jgi:hypothetical protein
MGKHTDSKLQTGWEEKRRIFVGSRTASKINHTPFPPHHPHPIYNGLLREGEGFKAPPSDPQINMFRKPIPLTGTHKVR